MEEQIKINVEGTADVEDVKDDLLEVEQIMQRLSKGVQISSSDYARVVGTIRGSRASGNISDVAYQQVTQKFMTADQSGRIRFRTHSELDSAMQSVVKVGENLAYTMQNYIKKEQAKIERRISNVVNPFGVTSASDQFERELKQMAQHARAQLRNSSQFGASRFQGNNLVAYKGQVAEGQDPNQGVDAVIALMRNGVTRLLSGEFKEGSYKSKLGIQSKSPSEVYSYFEKGAAKSIDYLLRSPKFQSLFFSPYYSDSGGNKVQDAAQQFGPRSMRQFFAARTANETAGKGGQPLFQTLTSDILNEDVDFSQWSKYRDGLIAKMDDGMRKEVMKAAGKSVKSIEEAVDKLISEVKIPDSQSMRKMSRIHLANIQTPDQIDELARSTGKALSIFNDQLGHAFVQATKGATSPEELRSAISSFRAQIKNQPDVNEAVHSYLENLENDLHSINKVVQDAVDPETRQFRPERLKDIAKRQAMLSDLIGGNSKWAEMTSRGLTNLYHQILSDVAEQQPGVLGSADTEWADRADRILSESLGKSYLSRAQRLASVVAKGTGPKAIAGLVAVGTFLSTTTGAFAKGEGIMSAATDPLALAGVAALAASTALVVFRYSEAFKRLGGGLKKIRDKFTRGTSELSGAGGLMGGPTGQLNGPPTQALVKSVQSVGSAITEWAADATKDAQKARQQIQSISTNVVPDLGRSLTQDENDEQKKLYKQLARQYHPDMLRQKSAAEQAAGEEIFKRVNDLKAANNLGGLQGLRALAQASATAAKEITKDTQAVRGLSTAADKASSELTQAAVESQRVVKDATPNVPSAQTLTHNQQVSMDNMFRQMKYMAENMYKNGMPSKRKVAQQNAAELVAHMNNVRATGNYGFMRELAQAGKDYVPVMRRQKEAMARLTASTTEAASEIREGAIVPLKSMPVANIPSYQGTNAIVPVGRRPNAVPVNTDDDGIIEGQWRNVEPMLALGAGGSGQPPAGGPPSNPQGGFAGPWTNAINKVKNAFKSLWDFLKRNPVERAVAAFTKFASVLQSVAQHISRFRQNVNQAFNRANQITSQFTNYAKNGLNRLGQTLDQVGKKFQSFGDRVRNGFQSASQSAATLYFLSSTMTQAGSRLSGFGKSQLRGASQDIQKYMSFEQAAIKAAVSSGDSMSEVQDFVFGMQRGTYGTALDMFNAEEIAQAAYYYSSAGVGQNVFSAENAQGTSEALAPILQVAAATQTSVESMVKGVVQASQQFGIDPANNPRAMGGIAKIFGYLANISTMEVPDILESLKYVGPMANVLSGGSPGAGMDQVLMALLFGSRMGIKGSMLGRGIQQMMSSITDAAFGTTDTKARTALSAMGVEGTPGMSAQEQFRTTFFNDDKTLKGGFAGMLNTIFSSADGGGDMSALLTLLFPQNASRAGVAIGASMMKEMEKMRTDSQFRDVLQSLALDPESAETSAKVTQFYDAMVAETSTSVTASVKRMQNAWFQFSSSIITAVKGPLKAVLNTLSDIIFHISDVISKNPMFATLVTGAISLAAVLATLVGTILTTGGTIFMIQRSFIMAGGAVSLFLGVITTAIPALFSMIPVLLLVGAAVAAFVGYLNAAGVDFQSIIGKFTGGFGGLATDETDKFFSDLSDRLADLTSKFVTSAEIASKAFYQFVNAILFAREGVGTDYLEAGLQKIFGVSAGSGMMAWMTQLRDGLDGARKSSDSFFGSIKTKAKALTSIGDVVKGLGLGAVFGFQKATQAGGMGAAANSLVNQDALKGQSVYQMADSLPILENIDKMGDVFGITRLSETVLMVGDTIREVINQIIGYFNLMRQAVEIPLQSIKTNLAEIFDTDAGNAFMQLIYGIAKGIAGGFVAAVLSAALAVSALTGYLSRMNWEGSRVQTLIKNMTGLQVSINQVGIAAGAVFGGMLFGRLLLAITPIAKLTIGLAKLGTLFAKLGVSVLGFVAKLVLMAAQFVINIVLMGLELSVMAAVMIIRAGLAAISWILSSAQAASAASAMANAGAQSVQAAAEGVATGATMGLSAAMSTLQMVMMAVIIVIMLFVATCLIAGAAILALNAALIVSDLKAGKFREALSKLKDMALGVWDGIKALWNALKVPLGIVAKLAMMTAQMLGFGDSIRETTKFAIILLGVPLVVFLTAIAAAAAVVLAVFNAIVFVIQGLKGLWNTVWGAITGDMQQMSNGLADLIDLWAAFIGIFDSGAAAGMRAMADALRARYAPPKDETAEDAQPEEEKKSTGSLLSNWVRDNAKSQIGSFLEDHPEVASTLQAAGFDTEQLTMNPVKLKRVLTPQEASEFNQIVSQSTWGKYFGPALDEVNRKKKQAIQDQIDQLKKLRDAAAEAGATDSVIFYQNQISELNGQLEQVTNTWEDITGAQAMAEEQAKLYEERLTAINDLLANASSLPTWQDYAKVLYPGESPYTPSVGQVVLANEDKANDILKGRKYYWSSSGTWNADETYGGVNGRMELDSSRDMTLYDLFFGMDTANFANAEAGTNIRRSLLSDAKLQEMASYYGFDINALADAMPYYNAVPQITDAVKGEMLTDVSAPVRQQLDRVGVNNEALAQYFASMVGAGEEGNLVDFVMAEYGVAKDKALEMLKQWGIDQDAVTTGMFDDLKGVIFDGYGNITGITNETMMDLSGRIKQGPLGKYIQMTKEEYDSLDAVTKAFLAQQGVIISTVTQEQADLIKGGAAGLKEAVDQGLITGFENVDGILHAYYIDPISGLRVSVPAPTFDEWRDVMDPGSIFAGLSGGSASIASGWVTGEDGKAANNAAADSLVNDLYLKFLEKAGFTKENADAAGQAAGYALADGTLVGIQEGTAAAAEEARAAGASIRHAFYEGLTGNAKTVYQLGGSGALANSIVAQDLYPAVGNPELTAEVRVDIIEGQLPPHMSYLRTGYKDILVKIAERLLPGSGILVSLAIDAFTITVDFLAGFVDPVIGWIMDHWDQFWNNQGGPDSVSEVSNEAVVGAVRNGVDPTSLEGITSGASALMGPLTSTQLAEYSKPVITETLLQRWLKGEYTGDEVGALNDDRAQTAMGMFGNVGWAGVAGGGVDSWDAGSSDYYTGQGQYNPAVYADTIAAARLATSTLVDTAVKTTEEATDAAAATKTVFGQTTETVTTFSKKLAETSEGSNAVTTAADSLRERLLGVGSDGDKTSATLGTLGEKLAGIGQTVVEPKVVAQTNQAKFEIDTIAQRLRNLRTEFNGTTITINIASSATATTPTDKMASGGLISSAFTMVGELGRELVSLPIGSRVFSASQTESIFAEASRPQVNMLTMPMEMPRQITMDTDSGATTASTESPIIVNFNGDMNIRDERDIQLLVDEIDRELGRRTQNAKRGMNGTRRSLSVD